jgi:hypothetical protein
VFSIKVLAMATAVSAGVVLAMPAPGQAMPQAAPIKIDAASNGNVAQVHYRKYRHRHYVRRYYPYRGSYIGIRLWPPLCIGVC